jgi:tetratricopeptide (TPR) repeat protein
VIITSCSYIGLALKEQGKYAKAKDYCLKALAMTKKMFGKECWYVASFYNKIDLTRPYLEEIDYDSDSLDFKEITYKALKEITYKDHPMAESYKAAIDYHLRALAIKEIAYGKDHSSVVESYKNIGTALYALGMYTESLVYHFEALAISEKLYGKDHPNTAESYNTIGSTFYAQEMYEESLVYHVQATAIREKLYGEDHPNTAESYKNTGTTLYALGTYTESLGMYMDALDYYQKALVLYEKVYGENDPKTTKLIKCIKSLEENLQNDYGSSEETPLLRSKGQPKEKECLDNCCIII